ncbi:alpha/beta hydrolase fold domain-containing protein [Candidatus Dactylopiibacterium carminicum]|nr:alpha/beta hydrolase fold domain-containing protein [Candidatus Dactylopiibacterium carminicum]
MAPPPSVHSQDLSIPGPLGALRLRLYHPGVSTPALPVVLYFHGGGFVAGSLEEASATACFIARHTPALVISADYALAPAHPFPAAPEDAYAAACWAEGHASGFGADATRMAVAGDDAGDNLAAALPLITRDRSGPRLAAQALICPMLDPGMTRLGDSRTLDSDLDARTCAARYRQYLPHPLQRMHPYASPLASTRHAGLPPALILTAGCDVLHAEAEKYAGLLIRSGVPTQVRRYADVKHAALASHPPALDEITHFLRRQFRCDA